jgi:hypothetical protein
MAERNRKTGALLSCDEVEIQLPRRLHHSLDRVTIFNRTAGGTAERSGKIRVVE